MSKVDDLKKAKHIRIGDVDMIRTVHLYQPEQSRTRCPICGGLGVPWAGWFHCEDCCAIAIYDGGATFVPLQNHLIAFDIEIVS